MLCSRNCKRKLRPYDMSYNPGDVEVLMGRNNSPLCPPQPWTGPITFLSVCNTVYIPKIAECYIRIQLVSNQHLMAAHDIQ